MNTTTLAPRCTEVNNISVRPTRPPYQTTPRGMTTSTFFTELSPVLCRDTSLPLKVSAFDKCAFHIMTMFYSVKIKYKKTCVAIHV